MRSGYVYILINHSMPGLLKIGKTTRDSRARARELSTTALPMPYIVAFEVFSESCDILEKEVHARLADFRVVGNREFFRYPLDKTIQLLIQLSAPPSEGNSEYAAVDILDRLVAKCKTDLAPDIVAVRIVQKQDRVWLEVTREEEIAGYLKDQLIKRSDLAFIMGEECDQSFFPPSDSVLENARRFVEEYDPFSIIMTTDLFHEEACKRIDRELNPIYKEGQKTNPLYSSPATDSKR
jgi:hypothetical protein